jgi:hypothetical protein
MYKTSQDYEQLYSLVASGACVAAFVEYKMRPTDFVCKDICKVERVAGGNILMYVRGMQYGGVYTFDVEDKSEIEIFKLECQSLNLSWIQG